MRQLLSGIFIVLSFTQTWAQPGDTVHYHLSYQPGSKYIQVRYSFPAIKDKSINFVIPRSAPGTYDLTDYSLFFEKLTAATDNAEHIAGKKSMGSYFEFLSPDAPITSISYHVAIEKMENQLHGAYASSKVRPNYLGMLGYAVFGFLKPLQNNPVKLTIETASDWPIFSTLAPKMNRSYGKANFEATNFDILADGQYLLGEGVKIWQGKAGTMPLFVALYTETEANIEEIGRRGLLALEGVQKYFGFVPMPHYVMCYEYLIPKSSNHLYNFSMEHLNSMTSSLDTSRAIISYEENPRLGGAIHHMGHSWIPLRCYGEGYRPFDWETAPLIETIWLNEGFIWYISGYKIIGSSTILDRFRNTITTAPDFINKKSLRELSLLGSTQYSKDFRIGQNLFSRGALMAYEMDEYIQKQSNGTKTFKDAVINLYRWSEKHRRAFDYEEILTILSDGAGVDLSPVWEKWQKPVKE
ncbi:hypothetical protein QQ020_18310 [Fulvivirgaceae bacterium BMA12]|uniref:Peptidase M61 N-terminal domain-containing protein n=1 Tax=Agaribacillus aureus TaxID=3051825 RepID=A0ABT8L9W1_9BACT|nr:hypothetical protein [Fulvivirgaceae bacterium BMA12]